MWGFFCIFSEREKINDFWVKREQTKNFATVGWTLTFCVTHFKRRKLICAYFICYDGDDSIRLSIFFSFEKWFSNNNPFKLHHSRWWQTTRRQRYISMCSVEFDAIVNQFWLKQMHNLCNLISACIPPTYPSRFLSQSKPMMLSSVFFDGIFFNADLCVATSSAFSTHFPFFQLASFIIASWLRW